MLPNQPPPKTGEYNILKELLQWPYHVQQVRKVVGTLVQGVNNVTFSCNISIFLQECCHIEMTWKCIGPDLRKFDRTVLHFYRTKGLSVKMAVTIYSLVNSLLPMPYELSS